MNQGFLPFEADDLDGPAVDGQTGGNPTQGAAGDDDRIFKTGGGQLVSGPGGPGPGTAEEIHGPGRGQSAGSV